MSASRYCKQPDRDAPKMECGYPLPCPWHTAVVAVSADRVRVREAPAKPLTAEQRDALYAVGHAMKQEKHRRRTVR